MKSSTEGINIAACAQSLDVDNRISLRYYYRIADSIRRQADIFRAEKNIIDLYVMLLRFSSLVTETIPRHREYGAYVKCQQVYFKKKLLIALNELEQLKPAVQQKVNESSRNQVYQANGLGDYSQNESSEWPLVRKEKSTNYHMRKEARPAIQESMYQSQRAFIWPCCGRTTPKTQSKENESQTERDRYDSEQERSRLGSILSQNDEVQDLIPALSPPVTETECAQVSPSADGFIRAEARLQLHLSTAMMEGFMRLAKSNTDKNLETCGVLAGSLKNRNFFVTTLIIPKQESTTDTCHTINEEEIFEVQAKQSLFTLGWIHTHPTQSCFMSSVDVHTHYSYQIMLPEAVAIVMAPRDGSRKHGIFRLTYPAKWVSSAQSASGWWAHFQNLHGCSRGPQSQI